MTEQQLEPCANPKYQQLVNADCKCMICNKNIHIFCSATPTVDGEGDIICPSCHIINEDVPSDGEQLVEDYVPSHSSSSSSSRISSSISSNSKEEEEVEEVDDLPLDIIRVADARGWVTFVTQSAMMAEGKIPIANCATLSNQYISRKIKCKSDSKSVGSLINILE
mmetsp:Transcript_7929/g.11516  ORF Transcript_7929/g.11516 Transcript_7929/m.11516 type:complete len:166 (+) Transcript_7929:744-1241(+)